MRVDSSGNCPKAFSVASPIPSINIQIKALRFMSPPQWLSHFQKIRTIKFLQSARRNQPSTPSVKLVINDTAYGFTEHRLTFLSRRPFHLERARAALHSPARMKQA